MAILAIKEPCRLLHVNYSMCYPLDNKKPLVTYKLAFFTETNFKAAYDDTQFWQ